MIELKAAASEVDDVFAGAVLLSGGFG